MPGGGPPEEGSPELADGMAMARKSAAAAAVVAFILSAAVSCAASNCLHGVTESLVELHGGGLGSE